MDDLDGNRSRETNKRVRRTMSCGMPSCRIVWVVLGALRLRMRMRVDIVLIRPQRLLRNAPARGMRRRLMLRVVSLEAHASLLCSRFRTFRLAHGRLLLETALPPRRKMHRLLRRRMCLCLRHALLRQWEAHKCTRRGGFGRLSLAVGKSARRLLDRLTQCRRVSPAVTPPLVRTLRCRPVVQDQEAISRVGVIFALRTS